MDLVKVYSIDAVLTCFLSLMETTVPATFVVTQIAKAITPFLGKISPVILSSATMTRHQVVVQVIIPASRFPVFTKLPCSTILSAECQYGHVALFALLVLAGWQFWIWWPKSFSRVKQLTANSISDVERFSLLVIWF